MDFDTHHKKAISLAESLSGILYVPYCVINESASVLTYKHSKEQANQFLAYLSENDSITLVDDQIEEEIKWFREYPKRMSFTDISLLWLSQHFHASLVTFDIQLAREYKKLAS